MTKCSDQLACDVAERVMGWVLFDQPPSPKQWMERRPDGSCVALSGDTPYLLSSRNPKWVWRADWRCAGFLLSKVRADGYRVLLAMSDEGNGVAFFHKSNWYKVAGNGHDKDSIVTALFRGALDCYT